MEAGSDAVKFHLFDAVLVVQQGTVRSPGWGAAPDLGPPNPTGSSGLHDLPVYCPTTQSHGSDLRDVHVGQCGDLSGVLACLQHIPKC